MEWFCWFCWFMVYILDSFAKYYILVIWDFLPNTTGKTFENALINVSLYTQKQCNISFYTHIVSVLCNIVIFWFSSHQSDIKTRSKTHIYNRRPRRYRYIAIAHARVNPFTAEMRIFLCHALCRSCAVLKFKKEKKEAIQRRILMPSTCR